MKKLKAAYLKYFFFEIKIAVLVTKAEPTCEWIIAGNFASGDNRGEDDPVHSVI